MKNSIKTSLLTLILSGVVFIVQAQTYVVSPNWQQDERLISDFFNAIVNADFSKLENCLHAEYVGYGPEVEGKVGQKEVTERWQRSHKDYGEIKIENVVNSAIEVKEGNLKGSWILSWGDYSAVHKETGKKISFPFQLTSTVNNGKITGSRLYYNEMDVARQLGYTLQPPKK